MGRHSVRGTLTGEELNVVRNYSDNYVPKHGIREGYVDTTFVAAGDQEVDIAVNASQPATNVVPLSGFANGLLAHNCINCRGVRQ